MFPILFFIPVLASFALGVVFVVLSDARPWTRILVVIVFALAAYLQFLTRFALAGLVLQVGLALSLLLWRRLDRSM